MIDNEVDDPGLERHDMTYFGVANRQGEDVVPVPVGRTCPHCHEVFVATDEGVFLPNGGDPLHMKCFLEQTLD